MIQHLRQNDMIQKLSIKDDHYALGLIDSFARALKKDIHKNIFWK